MTGITMVADHEDFDRFLVEAGLTHESMESARASMPPAIPSPEVQVSVSEIEGLGVFAKESYWPGQIIGMAMEGKEWTELGRYCNHAEHPNAEMVNRTIIRAIATILPGAEITISYRDAKLSLKETIKTEATQATT